MRYLAHLGLAFACALYAGCSGEREPDRARAVSGELVASGLCERVGEAARYATPGSTAGYTSRASMKIKATDGPIPLRKGVGFGFEWKARGLPGQSATVIFHMTHPPITRPDGKRVEQSDDSVTIDTALAAQGRTDCYFLSEDFEVVAGRWSMTVLFNGSPLVSRTFDVKP